jgi:polysaccharide biosynthesis/export protein
MRLSICLLFAYALAVSAQDNSATNMLMARDPRALNLPQVAVGPNDLLDIGVYDSPELSGTVRVDGEGCIKLPMLDQSVKVAGLLPAQIEQRLAEYLVRGQLIVKPQVRVTVAEYQSRTVVISGAVRKPTTFQAFGDVTLLDAITRADGLLDTAGSEILVESKPGEDGQRLAKRISTAALFRSVDSPENISLYGGEQIRVLEEGRISVIGDVKHAGVFPVREPQDASLLRLIAEAEGLEPNASAEAYIFHDTSKPQDKALNRIDLRRILEQKAPDINLAEGDVLYVPDNRGRRVTTEVLEHLLSAGAMTSSAFIYAGIH